LGLSYCKFTIIDDFNTQVQLEEIKELNTELSYDIEDLTLINRNNNLLLEEE
jgi:hypothetical protein